MTGDAVMEANSSMTQCSITYVLLSAFFIRIRPREDLNRRGFHIDTNSFAELWGLGKVISVPLKWEGESVE